MSVRINVGATWDGRGVEQAKRELAKLERQAEDMGGKMSRLSDRFKGAGSAMADFGGKMTRTVTTSLGGLATAAGFAVSAASDLEQSVGAVESVFGPASKTIMEFGETAAESFGLSRTEVNQTGAILGAQLKSMGFSAEDAAGQVVGLQQRAADMAATFGGSTSEALEAVGSLMRGERDPIEKYGVSIKQADINARLAADGLTGLTGEAAKQAEAQAALALLFEQTADIQGQFASESETFEGQQQRLRAEFENLKGEIGTAFMPVALELVGMLKESLIPIFETVRDVFAGLDDDTKMQIVRWGALVAAIGPVVMVVGGLFKMFGTLLGGAKLLGTGIAALTTPFGIAVAAVAALIAIGVYLWKNWDTIKANAQETWADISALFEGARDRISGAMETAKTNVLAAWQGMKDGLKGIGNGIIGAFNAVIGGIERVVNAAASAVNGIPSVTIPDWVPLWGGNRYSIPNIPRVDLPRIPALAEGGLVTQPTLALIGEAGPEVVTPLDRMGGVGGGVMTVVVPVMLDGREIGRSEALVDTLARQSSRRAREFAGVGL